MVVSSVTLSIVALGGDDVPAGLGPSMKMHYPAVPGPVLGSQNAQITGRVVREDSRPERRRKRSSAPDRTGLFRSDVAPIAFVLEHPFDLVVVVCGDEP